MTFSSKPKFDPCDIPEDLPLLPLRNSVFFPGAVMPLTIGRARTIRLIEDTIEESSLIAIVAQQSPEVDDPAPMDLYKVGTVARVIKLARTGKDGFSIVVEGLARFRVAEVTQTNPFLRARIEIIEDAGAGEVEVEALAANLKETAREVIDMLPELPVMSEAAA